MSEVKKVRKFLKSKSGKWVKVSECKKFLDVYKEIERQEKFLKQILKQD